MALTVRECPGVNVRGLSTLAWREIRRFLVVWVQTLVGPLVFALLLLTVFGVAMGQGHAAPRGMRYVEFLAPGLIIMTMLQNAFANTSSSILIAKVSGTIADVLMAPLHSWQLTLGYAVGGLARGLILGAALALIMAPFAGAPGTPWLGLQAAAFGLGATMLFSLVGIVGGIVARRMEHIAFMSQIIVAPLTLLSGTFFSIEILPSALRDAIVFNPVFYLIDGFRGGYVGFGESNVTMGLVGMVGAIAALFLLCTRMFARGYCLKP